MKYWYYYLKSKLCPVRYESIIRDYYNGNLHINDNIIIKDEKYMIIVHVDDNTCRLKYYNFPEYFDMGDKYVRLYKLLKHYPDLKSFVEYKLYHRKYDSLGRFVSTSNFDDILLELRSDNSVYVYSTYVGRINTDLYEQYYKESFDKTGR